MVGFILYRSWSVAALFMFYALFLFVAAAHAYDPSCGTGPGLRPCTFLEQRPGPVPGPRPDVELPQRTPEPLPSPSPSQVDWNVGFLFPASSRRYLKREELQRLSADQLRIARNEIFARRGRYFKDQRLDAHFRQFAWYRPSHWRDDMRELNEFERYNVKLIQQVEQPPAPAIESVLIGPIGPVAPGAATADGRSYEVKRVQFERSKGEAFRRIREIAKLRDQCRERRPSCSADGLAYDEREAVRRRDRQYFTWGEAAYYIPWSDALVPVPPELKHEIGTLGGVKIFGAYGGDKFYIYVIKGYLHYGSTAPGGQEAAALGYKKALADNQGFKPW